VILIMWLSEVREEIARGGGAAGLGDGQPLVAALLARPLERVLVSAEGDFMMSAHVAGSLAVVGVGHHRQPGPAHPPSA
jgi:hypothetical protein